MRAVGFSMMHGLYPAPAPLRLQPRVSPPTQAPTGQELSKHPAVIAAIERAWRDSRVDDPERFHEEGGWIYLNRSTGEIFTHRALPGGSFSIDLSGAVLDPYPNSVVVGSFHTHPSATAILGPSSEDIRLGERRGVPGIVRATDGLHVYGPTRRESLDGYPAYPTF